MTNSLEQMMFHMNNEPVDIPNEPLAAHDELIGRNDVPHEPVDVINPVTLNTVQRGS